MKTTIKVLFLSIIFTTVGISLSAKNNDEPNFAFPKTVSQQAETNLNVALKNRDGMMVVKSLIEYAVAQDLINTDSIQSTINKIEQIASQDKNPSTRVLLNLLLIDIYSDIESSRINIYNNRPNTSSAAPSDITEWNNGHFREKKSELYNKVLDDSDALKRVPLRNYADIITHNNLTFIYYPTLYDFAILRLIKTMTISSDNPQPIDLETFLKTPTKNFSKENSTDKLFHNVMTFHINDIAPLINWEIMRLDFLKDDYFYKSLEQLDFNNIQSFEKDLNNSRINGLIHLYKKYEDSEYASLVLINLWDFAYREFNDTQKRDFYILLKERVKRFPTFNQNCKLQKIINDIEYKSVSIDFNTYVAPNDEFNIILKNHNCNNVKIDIIRLPDDVKFQRNYTFKEKEQPIIYKTIKLDNDSIIPFCIYNDTIKTSISQPGYYSIIAYESNSEYNLRHLQIVYCSELATLNLNGEQNDNRIWAINPKNGQFITDATIELYASNNSSKNNHSLVGSFKSSRDGRISTKLTSNTNYLFIANKGIDHYCSPNSLYISNNYVDTTWADNGVCLTSLPIYHPGDIVEWSAVIYSTQDNNRKLAKNKTYTISFRDANYMEIDTAIVTSDNYGRIAGKFTIPSNRITGNYSITITGRFNRNVSNCSFMVSDYKLPTFDTKITDISKESNGNFIITGEVRSFSGFTLAGASVDLELTNSDYDFYRIDFNSRIHKVHTTTDANGKFTITISPTFYTSYHKLIFKAKITVTSQNGESQETIKYFTNGEPYYISAYGLENSTIEATKNVSLNVEILKISGSSVNGIIYYSIINQNKQSIKSGSFESTNPIVDWSDVPSGTYKLSLYSTNPTPTDTTTHQIWIYRTSDPLPPCKNGLWIQHDNYSITLDNSVGITYGTTFDSGEILYILYDENQIYSTRLIKAKPGIHNTRVIFPPHLNNAKIKLYAINNYNSSEVNATINRESAQKELTITAESFRNNIVPGSEEEWTFKITDKSGYGTQSAVLLDMYSLAINKLKPHYFGLYFSPPSISNIYLSHNNFIMSSYRYQQSITPEVSDCPELISPMLYTYGHFFGASEMDMVMLSARPEAYAVNRASGSMKRANITIEAEDERQINPADAPSIPLRDNETPLAFFRPMLTTDADGYLTFSFTAPNANTTWLFNAIAYNNDMIAANFSREVISNKPVMVQPNIPRLLRSGDKATIKATIMNNSTDTLAINTIIELFDPTTNKTITTHSQSNIISAHESSLAEIEITAPIDATMIGYRIKSYSNNFGDGEQSLIPILPATSPVIETTTFYMGVNEKSFTQKLPTMPADARVTLEFCENPTWYAVTALPGLSKNQSRTSISAAMNIYSASISDGIVHQNPQIANALYQWLHSDKSDSTLVSMLSRNQDLKNILLTATPWIQNADNDTERMTRLALLFDQKGNKSIIDKNIHFLATLQRNGGGWAWIAEADNASTWATLSILNQLGQLKQLGFLPDNENLNTMIKNAINYIDKEYTSLFKENPNGDYSQYVFVRDMFPEYKQSTASKKITNATIQQIISNWGEYPLAKKAIVAIILNNNGYNSSAREILNSITEYSQSSPSRGTWWPTLENSNTGNLSIIHSHAIILDAFHQITPNNSEIDKMRQWLILNKEANDWGNSSATSFVIYTLLNTGSRWTNKALGCEIMLNNEDIEIDRFDNISGYLRTDISEMSPSDKTLSIAKHGNQPAWGAIYRQYDADMSQIEAVEGNDISIEKTLLKQVGNTWVTASDYSVGDVIKIQLTIKAKRDINYVTIRDERAACFEPIEQLPKPIFSEGISFYRENRNDATNIFITNLPKGTYILSYDMYVNNEGVFASGIATIQSQYTPQITAHSDGKIIHIK